MTARFKQSPGSRHVGFEGAERIPVSHTDLALRSQVEDRSHVVLGQRPLDQLHIAKIALDHTASVRQSVSDKF
jgi:hypothetical protein